jgi:hypothetical protein
MTMNVRLIHIQSRDRDYQIDLVESHIGSNNIQRSQLNKIDDGDILVDTDIVEDTVNSLTLLSYHTLEGGSSFRHHAEISQTDEYSCESIDFQRVHDRPQSYIDKRHNEDWERPMKQMIGIVCEGQNGLDVRINSALHSDLEKSRAGEYSKFLHYCSESAQPFSPLEKRE